MTELKIKNINPDNSESGLSLISALWIMAVLSVLATQFLFSVRLEQRTQANFTDRTKYYYAAKAGIETAIAYLRVDQTSFDSLGEIWAEPITGQVEDGIQVGRTLTFSANLTDEGSKININTVDADTLNKLLQSAGYQEDANLEEGVQTLAQKIEAARPFRTIRDLGRVEGMTEQILFGDAMGQTMELRADINAIGQMELNGLINHITVYSADKNTAADGTQRTNINQADAEQIRQIQGDNRSSVFDEDEANALIEGRTFNNLGDLLDASAVPDDIFDQIENRLTTDDENDEKININSADAEKLADLDGIGEGTADRIINHRDDNGSFNNIDQLKEVKLITEGEFREIVDSITVVEGNTISGLINLNTAPAEVLMLLPNMTEEMASAIIIRRETAPEDNDPSLENVEGNPFQKITDLFEIEGFSINIFKDLAGRITFRSHGFMIIGSGIDSNGKIVAKCESIVDRTSENVKLTYWRQH